MAPLAPEEAARLVGAAIRFGRQNGFRIDADVLKWSSFLPGVSPETADLSDFGYEHGDSACRAGVRGASG